LDRPSVTRAARANLQPPVDCTTEYNSPMFPADHCTECGASLRERGVREYYHLEHTYGVDQPVGTVTHQHLAEDIGTFCSARCLVEFVSRRISPDAIGEG